VVDVTESPEGYAALQAELLGRWPENAIDPSLSRISAIMDLLGEPQLAYPVIQVTGTNGKSSTARMIASLLRALGLRTGLYTSPHLIDMRERIEIDGEPISAQRFMEVAGDVAPFIASVDARAEEEGGTPVTYFETLTAIAYAAFADAPVDVAVVEVGLGGTWDATSVCQPQVSVVTRVAMDHADILGDRIDLIAGEKAGIIKPGRTPMLPMCCRRASTRSACLRPGRARLLPCSIAPWPSAARCSPFRDSPGHTTKSSSLSSVRTSRSMQPWRSPLPRHSWAGERSHLTPTACARASPTSRRPDASRW
jgi:folylpolyglutamate synthase/dihydropteroate synthase